MVIKQNKIQPEFYAITGIIIIIIKTQCLCFRDCEFCNEYEGAVPQSMLFLDFSTLHM